MKKTLKRNGRKISALILSIVMVFSMAVNVSAAWVNYNQNSVVYLDEIWVGSKQCINYYNNGQWIRNVAGEKHTLWINGNPVLYDLYDTGYWCFDKKGNTFAIDTSRRLLVCKAGSTTFQVNSVITGCTGFQRDNGKVGYLVYTNNGTYSLDNLLNGNYSTYNGGSNTNSSIGITFPYVQQDGNVYYYYINSTKYFKYFLNNSILYFKGTDSKDVNNVVAREVQDITFTNNGYVVCATLNKEVLAYTVSMSPCKKIIGNNFSYFNENNKIGLGYYNINGSYQAFSSLNNNNYSNNDYYDNSYDYQSYPYVKKSGSNYYYYTSSSRYYKYYLTGSTLYYKGTNNSSSDVKLASSVDEITFSSDGHIVYATTSNYVYSYPVGKTSASYKETVGKYFSYFHEDYNDYMSTGYYNTSGSYKEFSDYYEDVYDDYDDYPYVKKSGSYYYYYTSSSRYYKYYLTDSTLYYKGSNSSENSIKLATSVDEITFSPDGYIAYSVNDSYDRVYAYPIGKTSSSYKELVGKYFGYFDEDYGDYMSSGYYDEDDDFIDFDF